MTAIALANATRLPRRPDPSILNQAIPLFFLGRNRDGFWVVRESDGPVGGIFLRKQSALRFIKRSAEPLGYAMMLVEEGLELDIKNRGNRFVVQLAAVKLAGAHLAGKITFAARMLVGRFFRILADQRSRRTAIEKEVFGGHYRYSSKNDDDLPIFP